MKKRLLSTFLALAMVFSIMPTGLADSAVGIAGPTGGQTYDSSATLTGSTNVVSSVEGTFNKGVGSITVKLGSFHDQSSNVYAMLFPTSTINETYSLWSEEKDAGEYISEINPGNLITLLTGSNEDYESTLGSAVLPTYHNVFKDIPAGTNGGEVTLSGLDFSKETIASLYDITAEMVASDPETYPAEDHFTDNSIDMCLLIAVNEGKDTTEEMFVYKFNLDLTSEDFPIPVGATPTASPTNAPAKKITGANLGNITASGLTAAPPATVSSSDSNAALNTDLTVTYTWNPTTGGGSGATFPTTPGSYTLTATAALASGTTYTLADDFELSGTGWTTPVGGDAKVATATIIVPGTITAADLTNISTTAHIGDSVPSVAVTSATPSSTVSLDSITWTDSKTDSDTFTAEKTYTATATLKAATPAVYSFATTGALAVNSTTTNGWKITSNDGTTVTMTKDVTVTTNNVTAADVVVTGTAPSDGTQVSAATFNVSTTTSGAELENNVVWKDPDNNTMSSTDTFEPGKKYTATITVTPKTGTNTVLGGAGTTSVDTTGVSGFDTGGVNVTSNTTTSVVVTAEVTIPKRTITTIGAAIAEPSAGQNPPTDVTSMSVGDGTHTENLADGTVATFGPKTDANKAAAGNGDWTATFVVTAPEGYKFNETANAYSSSNTTVTDWTVTDVTVASGGGSATVTVTHAQDPKKITAMSITSSNDFTKNTDENVTASDIGDLTVNLTYNDGTTGTATYTASTGLWDDTNFSLVADKKESTESGFTGTTAAVGLTSSTPALYHIYAKYAGSDLASGVSPYVGAGSADFEYPLIDTAGVTLTYPVVGTANVTTGSVPVADADKYEVQSIVWSKATPAYGDTNLTATVTLKGKNDHLFVNTPDTVDVTATAAAAATSATGTIQNATVASAASTDGGETVVVTFTFNMPAAPTASDSGSIDYYDGSGDPKITVSGMVDGDDIDTVKIGATTLVKDTDYTVSGGEITFTKSAVDKALNGASPTNLSTSSSSPTSYTVDVTTTKGGAVSGSLNAYNTTPYLTINATTGGTIQLSTESAAASTARTIALTKDTAYTATAAGTGDNVFKAWTDYNIGSTNPLTIAASDVTDGVRLTLGATFTGPKELTVTATNGKITSVTDNGSAITATGDKYKIYDGHTYVVTVTANNDYKFNDTTPWTKTGTVTTDTGNGTTSSTVHTYTFTAGSDNVTVTANLVADERVLTVNYTAADVKSVEVKGVTSNRTISATTVSGGATYNVLPSDGDVTVTVVANDDKKITGLTDNTAVTTSAPAASAATTVTVPTEGKTVAVTSAAKVAPTWKTGTDYTGDSVTHQLNVSNTELKYDADDTADYEFLSAQLVADSDDKSSVLSGTTTNERTISVTDLNTLTADKTYTLTYKFKDKLLYPGDNTKVYELTGKTIKITAAPTVSSVTLPTGLKHGDNMGTFEFKIGDDTYTYTVSGASGSWNNTPPSTTTVNVTHGSDKVAENMGIDAFITKYVASNTNVRKNGLTGGDVKATLRDGDVIAVGLNSTNYCTGATLKVDPKLISINITGNNNFEKDYDGDAIVDDTLTLSTTDSKVPADDVNFTDNTQIGAQGKYYAQGTNTEAKNAIVGFTHDVKFTKNLDTTNHKDLENYDITLADTTGKINKLNITIPATEFTNIPAAAYGQNPATGTGTQTGVTTSDLTSGTIVDSSLDIPYTYTYGQSSNDDTTVTITPTNASITNYNVTVTGTTTGTRSARAISGITVTPSKSSYYSSDSVDAEIVVSYSDSFGDDTYSTISDAQGAGVAVTWGTTASDTSGADVATATPLTVAAHNGKYIVAAKDGQTGNAQITVNKIPVNVTVSAEKISKVYDGDATFATGDTVTNTDPANAFGYSVAVDTTTTGETGTSKYSVSGVTASGATVAFAQADVYNKTVGTDGATQAQVATASGAIISDTTEYELKNTIANITSAQITAFPITIKQIDYIKPVKVGSAGTLSGIAAANRSVTNETDNGYEAQVTLNETLPVADKIVFDTTYEYANTTAATNNNEAVVNLKTILLAASATGNKNGNYSFTNLTESTTPTAGSVQGRGTVKDRTVNGITLLLPTKLRNAITYGTAPYDYKGGADYDGLEVTVDYGSDGITKYTWTDANGWEIVEAGVTAYQTNFTSVPFTLKWSAGGLTAPVDVDPTADILWTYNKNGRTMTAAMGSKSDAKSVEVKQKEITVAASYDKDSDGTADTPTKNFDGGSDIKPAGTWTYTTDGAVAGDTVTVTMASEKKVTYSDPNKGNNISLLFGGKEYNSSDINNQFTITVTGDDADKSRAGSYKVKEITGKTTGTINARPVTLTKISNIPSIQQFATQSTPEGPKTAYSDPSSVNDITAVFAAPTGSDDEGTGTGLLPAGLSVSFKYQYLDTNTAGELSDKTGTKLAITDITTSSSNSNYYLQYTPQAATAGDPDTRVEAVGSVTKASVESLAITAPKMFGKTATEVQYGDIFDFDGLAVAVNFSGGIVETYKPKEYDASGEISKWTKSSSTGAANEDVTTVPFTLAGSGGDLPTQGQKLTTVVTEGGTKLKATLKNGEAHTDSTAPSATTATGLVVGPRQVTPTASITAPATKVSKVYDSTTTYSTTAGTGYNTSTGDIEIALTGKTTSYTAAADKDASGNYTLPAALGTTATYAYNSANVADANKINITAITLAGTLTGGDALANYTLTANTDDVPAEITKRDVIITNVRYIDAIAQGSAIAAASADITTNNTAKPYAEVAVSTPVAGSDVLDLTIGYTYTSSAVASAKDGSGNYLDDIAVTISSVAAKAGTATAANYNVYADMDDNTNHTGAVKATGHGTVTPAAVTLTVTNPTQLDANYTFGTPLNVDGLTVNVKYGDAAGTDYIAKVESGAVKWHKGSATGEEVAEADLPFAYAWTDLKNGGTGTILTNGAQLPPKYYNGANIEATLKEVDSTGSQPTAQGADVTVNKKEISNIKATLPTGQSISKVYNRTLALKAEDEAKITYAVDPDEFVTGYGDNFAVTATPAYDSKNVNTGIGISFTDAGFASGAYSDNYKFASTVNVKEFVGDTETPITGDITKATITVTNVYIPSITADNTITADKDVVITGAQSGAAVGSGVVTTNGIVDGEADYITFGYTIVYRQADADGSAGTSSNVFVTMKDTNEGVTTDAATNGVTLDNYNVSWVPVATRSTASAGKAAVKDYAALTDGTPVTDYLLGNVAADTYTKLEITAPDKLSGVNAHTHGDILDLTGLTVTLKSNTLYPNDTTFAIAGTPGAQYWAVGGTKTPLPEGVTVKLGAYELTTEADLANLQAHYTNMNTQKFVANATPSTPDNLKAETSAMEVKKATITVTPSKTTGVDKFYDSTDNVVENITYTLSATKTFTKHANGANYTDVVTVSNKTTPKYEQADVKGTAAYPEAQNITFDLQLGGADAENYTVTNPTGVTGTIKPRTVKVSAFGDDIKAADAIYKDTSDANAKGTINNIEGRKGSENDVYTYSWLFEENPATGTLPTTLKAPDINITYDYGTLVNTITDPNPAAIPNADATVTTGNFQAAFSTATNNFVLDYTLVLSIPGLVKAAGIDSIVIDKTKKDYTYGDALTGAELDDIEIKLYKTGDSNPFETFYYSSRGASNATVLASQLDAYGLKLVLKNNGSNYDQTSDVLKATAATVQVVEDKTGGKESNVVELNVAKRKLLLVQDGTVTREYNGSTAVTPSTITLKVADDAAQTAAQDADTGSVYGLYLADKTALGANTFTVTKPTTMTYTDGTNAVKNAGTDYTISASNDAAISTTATGVNTDQYELVLGELKGNITAKEVEITPVIGQKVYKDNSDIDIAGSSAAGSSNSVTATGFVSGEESNYTITYTIPLTAEQHNSASATVNPKNADLSGWQSVTSGDGYTWKVVTGSANYPLGNYTYSFKPVTVSTINKSAVKAEILETDSKKIRTAYDSGEDIDFAKLVVKVTYDDDSVQTFEYGQLSWDDHFEIVRNDKTTTITNGTKLTTADNNERFYVKVTDTLTTQNATSQIKVGAKELQVSAKATSVTSRPYDATADADTFVEYYILDAPTGANVSLNATNTAKADFAEKPAAGTDAAIPPSYVGTDKPIVITANDSSFTLEGTDAAQYSVKWVNNPNLVGTVEKLPLYIESWPLLTAGRNITATEPATISYGGNVLIGDEAESKAVLDAASKAKITTTELQADLDKFRATFSADYTAAQLKTATTDPYNLTFTAGTPVITATGSDADLFEKNYELTYADPKGIVVPSAIQITNVSTPQASTHGDDNVNLEGMKFTVHYTADDAGNSAVYTFKNTGDQWYVVAGNNADDSDVVKEANKISKTQLLNNYGVQLRWNTKNSTGLEPDKVLSKANHEDDQKQIVIMVPLKDLTGTDEFAMAKTGNVTINKRPIYAYVKKSPVQIDKPYDGNDYADPSGVTFDFYVPDYPANATDPTLFSKYAKWFADEDVKINTPAKGERSTGEQLKAVYLGGTAANHDGSYKFNGTSWVECDIAGKDVRRDANGDPTTKPIQLSNLHLTGAGSDNYILVNADTWTLSAVDTGFAQYKPTTTPEEGSQELSNRLPGKITPIDATVTVTTVPPISKNTASTDLKRPVINGTSGAYTVNGLVLGDTLSHISVFATYPNNNPVQQNVEVTVEGDESDYAELNYNITPDPQYVMGSIMTIGIRNIEILEQPKLEYNHGDQLNLKDPENTDGMKIKVTYSDGTQKVWTYRGTGTSETYPWLVENYASGATPGTSLADSSDTVADLQDITLVWNDTNNAVTPNETMSCSDTNKGYTDSSNKKVTKIQVKPLLTTDPEETTYADSKYTNNITVSKRQLAYEITGSVTKVYDSDNVVKDATGLTVTLKDSEDNAVTDVTFDLNAAVAANAVTFVSRDTKPDSYAGDKTIAIANFNTYLDGTNIEDAYNMPTDANKTNTATGTITPRPITVTVTTVPTLDTNTAAPDEAGGTTYTLPLVKGTNFSVTGPENGTGIFQYGSGTLTADEADVVWNVIFDLDGVNTNIATTAPVTFSTGTLVGSTTSSEQPSTVAANYNPTFVANQTTGPITSLVQANHIAITQSPSKITYGHGDKLELDGTQVTVYKRWDEANGGFVDGTTEATVYTYDKTLNSNAGGWKIGETPVAPADVPFDLYWAAANDADAGAFIDANKISLTPDAETLSLTDSPNAATDTANGKLFSVAAALNSDKTINDAKTITVNKLQLYMHLTGSAEKVYDKDTKLSKDGTNHYDLTVAFTSSATAPAAGDPTVGTLADGKIDTWVTNGVITYKDTRTGTPDEYVGSDADKTLAVAVGNLGTDYLTGFDAGVYKLPTEAGHVIVGDVTASITARPITLVVDEFAPLTLTEEILAENTYSKDLAASDYDIYDGNFDMNDITDATPEWTLDSAVKWTITYDIAGLNLDNSRTADVTWGKDNATANAVPHQLTEAAAANYTVKWIAPDTGDVVLDTDPHIEILKHPTAKQNDDGTYTYGAPTDWEGFEYKVVTPEGTTNHRWDKDAGDWFVGTDPTTGKEYTAPKPGTTFKWNNETPDDELPTTKTLDVGKNEVEISVPTDTTPLTAKTNAWTAGKKELTIKVSGQHTKPYDGKTTLEDPNNEVTLTLEGALDGDSVTFATDPTVAFADKNVSYFKDPTHKPLTITGGTLSDEMAEKYTIKAEYELADDADIKIVPREIAILITAPAIKTNIAAAAKAITKTGVAVNNAAGADTDATKRAADTFILTNGKLADNDTVTIGYSGSYVDVTQGDKTTAGKATTDEKNAVFAFTATGTPAVEGASADNYTITAYDIEYNVSQATTGGGGGGGGGGTTNKLVAYYQNEDGTAGEEATEITVPLGTDPTDLIGVFQRDPANKTLVWTSSDENVVTVDEDGILTYVGVGEATITVASKTNKQLKDTVKVVVTEVPEPTDKPEPTTEPRTHERINDSLITKTMLNPYIVGYDDYVFGPELPISREELAAIFARLIANNLYMDKNYDTSFPDVPEKWSKSYIGYLEGFDVVRGYEDGLFRPENNITRAEMAVMMAKAEGYDITPDISAEEAGFPDVDAGYATWSAAKAIQILSDLGIMSGYEDGTFRPGQPITRAETVATVNRVLAAQEVAEREVLPSDVTDAHWAYEDIVFAMNHRVLKDAAADPHSFIWSEEFDKNMVTNTEKVAGEKEVIEGEEPSEDNTSDASDADNTEAGTATETKDEATTPKSTDKPTI